MIVLLLVTLTITVASRQNLTYDAPYPDIKASTDSAVIARGKEIVFGPAHCADCHARGSNIDSLLALGREVPLIGGYKFELPLGEIYIPNITPDSLTGIGRITDAEIARLLRYGVFPNGKAAFDFMPFHNMSDEDLAAVISYLRNQQPVYNKVPENDLNTLGKVLTAFVVKPVGPDREVPKAVKRDTSAAYGGYLAISVANCHGCHTLRDMTGGYIGEPFAGGGPIGEPGFPSYTPPNLTPDSSSRIFGWSQQNFIDRFRMGRVFQYSHMPWESFGRMSDDDLKAIYNFLQTVKPQKTGALLHDK